MSALEWLGLTALVALAVVVLCGFLLVVLGLVAVKRHDGDAGSAAEAKTLANVGTGTLLVGLLAALIFAGAVVLMLGNLAIAALLAIAP